VSVLTTIKSRESEDEEGEEGEVIRWERFRSLWDQAHSEHGPPLVRRVTELAAGASWVLALIIVFLTWNGAAERRVLAEQVPFIVSGGLTALLLALMGAVLLIYGAMLQAVRGSDPKEFDEAADVAGGQ
jgi:hypothetical protein